MPEGTKEGRGKRWGVLAGAAVFVEMWKEGAFRIEIKVICRSLGCNGLGIIRLSSAYMQLDGVSDFERNN